MYTFTFAVGRVLLSLHLQRSRPRIFEAPGEILLRLPWGESAGEGLTRDQYWLRGERRHVVVGDFPEGNIVSQLCLLHLLGGGQLLPPLRLESSPPALRVQGLGGPEHGADLGLGARHREDQVGGLGGRRGHRGLGGRGGWSVQ